MIKKIPFNKPFRTGQEIKYIQKSIGNGHISGRGPFTKKAENLLKKQLLISNDILLTTSCTHALEISSILMNFKPGDEVIVPSFTFVTTALAFYMHGAKIILADIREDTLNIDENKIEKLISKKTKCIVVVHYAGVGCEMNSIMKIAKKYNLVVIEDNAHGLYAKYNNQLLGTIGHLATLSFHETKNIICGEGGAIIINNKNYSKRAGRILEKGTDRIEFIKGKVKKYSWVDKGSSYILSDILAAFLYAQLEQSKTIINKRKYIWEFYNKNLTDWAYNNNVSLPFVPKHCEHSYHMYYIIMPNNKTRNTFIKYLANYNIQSIFHYSPLHLSKMIMKKNMKKYYCPVSKKISDRIIRLPFFCEITNKELNYIINKIKNFKN